jgi:glycosyltransferase involved in cell wall biosynthesis
MSSIDTICVVSDWVHGAPDEGIHNLARNLAEEWAATRSVRTLGVGPEFPVNRLFLSARMRGALRGIDPGTIVYLSSSCAKVAALARARMLKIYCPRSSVFVVAVQPAGYGPLSRLIASRIPPDGVFVQSPRAAKELEGLHCPVRFLPSGVDTIRFTAAGDAEKRRLRSVHGVDPGAYVVLHVGHINGRRNVGVLERLARRGGIAVVLVGSTSTPQDEDLARRLQEAGVRLIREFVPRIEEIYRLADAYLFPVVSEDAAIGVPLSVLEAMACNLPVITTPFGGLPSMFREGDGFFYFDDEARLGPLFDGARRGGISTRRMVEPYDWKRVASLALDMMQRKDVS